MGWIVATGIRVASVSRLVIAQTLRTQQVIVLQAAFLALSHTLSRLTQTESQAGPVQRAFSECVR